MKERPILFSGEMVRAIMEGRKTQTRRICKQGTDVGEHTAWAICPALEAGWIAWFGEPSKGVAEFTKKAYTHGFPCPYGEPGDRLWVRETFATRQDLSHVEYRASYQEPVGLPFAHIYDEQTRWKPSIFMPRRASRITLEITDVRVERVQDISSNDIKSEGVELSGNYRAHFRNLWESINEKRGYGWDTNPFVWCISFRRINPCNV